MSDQFFWYVTRSAALVTWLAGGLSILVGLMTSSRLLGRRPTIPWLVDFHRGLAALAVTFLGVHMLSLALDGYVNFGLADLLIPWEATVPGLTKTSMALGVMAAWIIVAVQASSLVRAYIPEGLWRTVHVTSFAGFPLGTLHAIQTGSDVTNPIVAAIGVSVFTAIGLATALRVIRLRRPEPVEPPSERGPSRPIDAGWGAGPADGLGPGDSRQIRTSAAGTRLQAQRRQR